ncbi:hypothetical protein M0805_000250 [Coniferiporia weirii]|nr:hypothetical protein M0805_000250 [Coniferiporia weirii]
MNKPLQLQRLPKAGRLSYLNFKRTSPGNFTRLINPGAGPSNDVVVDPSHPWARKPPRSLTKRFPYFESFALTIRAFPKALLLKPPQPTPSPPYMPARECVYGIDGKMEGTRRTLNMALMHVVTKKAHKSSVVRAKMRNRLKTALSLIVTRGATVERVGSGPNAKERLVFGDSEEFGEGWILQDWTYVIHPTLEVYRMPYTTLVRLLRHGLSRINTKAVLAEQQWNEPDASEIRNDYPTTKRLIRVPPGETRKKQLTRQNPSFSPSRSLPEFEDPSDTKHANTSMARIKALLNTPDTLDIPDELISEDIFPEGRLSTSKPGRPAIPVWARPDFEDEPSSLSPIPKSSDSPHVSKSFNSLSASKFSNSLPVSKSLSPQPISKSPNSLPVSKSPNSPPVSKSPNSLSVTKSLSPQPASKSLNPQLVSESLNPKPVLNASSLPPVPKEISLSRVLFSQKPILRTAMSRDGGQERSGDRTERPRDRNQRRGK